jgi:DNA-binding HxlR family transcriptional regulator
VTARVERVVRVGPGTTSDPAPHGVVAGSPRSELVGVTPAEGRPGLRPSSLLGSPPAASRMQAVGSLSRQAFSHDDVLSRSTIEFIYQLERHRGSFEILILLGREGRACKSRMRKRLRPSQRALDKALTSLQLLGLVEVTNASSFPFAKTFGLSERGAEIVMRGLLYGPVPEVE